MNDLNNTKLKLIALNEQLFKKYKTNLNSKNLDKQIEAEKIWKIINIINHAIKTIGE
jgi:hypothetical protein